VATVLFVCLRNAGRSQMSRALFERAAGGRHQALSAGSIADPAGRIHPIVVEAMREIGIDLADVRPQPLTTAVADAADLVVTMGCGDACPYVPGKHFIDWDVPDPAGLPLSAVRQMRDDIDSRIDDLVRSLDADTAHPRQEVT